LSHACLPRKSTVSASAAVRVTEGHDTASPVAAFTSAGAEQTPDAGPAISITGRVSKLPALSSTTEPPGVPAGNVSGNVMGNMIPVMAGPATTVSAFWSVEYLRGSGATRPTLNTTSASVGQVSGIRPDRLTSACFGTGSS
jgi:hypothetical protein